MFRFMKKVSVVAPRYQLSIQEIVHDFGFNPNQQIRVKNVKKINHTFEANFKLLTQMQNKRKESGKLYYRGISKNKMSAVSEIRQIFGKEVITISNEGAQFGRRGTSKKGWFRCNACVLKPSHVTAAAHSKDTPGVATHAGCVYKIERMIDHFVCCCPHAAAIKQCRAEECKEFLTLNPSENSTDFTTNVLLQQSLSVDRATYEVRLKHIGLVYNDMKCLTLSSRSFPSRDLVGGFVEHCKELGSGEWADFTPSEEQCRYNNPTAVTRYRELICRDVTNLYVKPLFGDQLLAVSVAYDGWRAHMELYIHGARCVMMDARIVHVFVALAEPLVGGAAGCVQSFLIAYRPLFDSDAEFEAFKPKVSSQTTDAASVNTGCDNGANVQIRTDILENANLPELICVGHCGHNAFADLLKAFGRLERSISEHKSTVSFSHRGEIMSDFRKYCRDVIFVDAPASDRVVPSRNISPGDTRMESHLYGSFAVFDATRDLWMLFIDDRSSNHAVSATRVCDSAIDFRKLVSCELFTNCLFTAHRERAVDEAHQLQEAAHPFPQQGSATLLFDLR